MQFQVQRVNTSLRIGSQKTTDNFNCPTDFPSIQLINHPGIEIYTGSESFQVIESGINGEGGLGTSYSDAENQIIHLKRVQNQEVTKPNQLLD